MTAKMRAWLLACPMVKGVSTLTADLHACRAIDLNRLLPRAVAVEMSGLLWRSDKLPMPLPMDYHERSAKMYSVRSRGRMVVLRRGIATTCGRLAGGVGISEACGRAVIHLPNATIPETVAVAVVGREMKDLIDSPVFRRSSYPIISAGTDQRRGLTLWFSTPSRAMPIDEALAVQGARRRRRP